MRLRRIPLVNRKRIRVVVGVGVAVWWFAGVGAAGAGTIRGTVRLTGPVVETRKVSVTADQNVCGKEKDSDELLPSPDRGIRNVVVSLPAAPATGVAERLPATVQMDQKQCAFAPRVVVVPVGGTVEFLNNDRLLHNLHSFSIENRTFNRVQPKGRTIPIEFNKKEIVRVDCDLHPWMRAWVVVADNPFYTVTNELGEFLIDRVPPGQHVLQLWQELLGTTTRNVSVADQGVTTVVVEMSRR
jgi:plastocyanin